MSEEKIIIQIETLSMWAGVNGIKVKRYRSTVAIVVGLSTMYFTYHLGNANFFLLLDGIKTEGKIVEYKQQVFVDSNRSYSTIFMPVVEFKIGDKDVRFRDWLGNRSNSLPGEFVPVIYNSANPSIAMVDRPVWNWIPFAIFTAGLLLVLVSIKNWIKFSRATPV